MDVAQHGGRRRLRSIVLQLAGRGNCCLCVLLCDFDLALHAREEAEIGECQHFVDCLTRGAIQVQRFDEHRACDGPVALGGGLESGGPEGSGTDVGG